MKNLLHLKFNKFLSILILSLSIVSCQSEYEKVEKRELASGNTVNEIFLGLELGMDKNNFYETCWDLNEKGVLTNGPGELSVEYQVELPSGNSGNMRFYPKFEENKIYLMPAEFAYDNWAPWNEELSSEKLLKDVVKLFEKWYGDGFFEVTNEDRSQIAWVKIDGNRRIRIFKKHISSVRAEISDLKIQKELAKEPA
ncbi:hypothetical protein [Algoriphagus antarcticus]|uniref:Uncharacterized protein n=1 Tax=Algoriphagus antarcticus TaxID=238540 RepID=A0A3E0D9R6_9BACT|nr:hypothetical protein [Algoriphagus antarcticus]REG79400.1 hypothetical protein C8N25_13230 [Algoriphagus antarcticus]